MNKHIGVSLLTGKQAVEAFEDEAEFDCDLCGRPVFRDDIRAYEDKWGNPYLVCRRCEKQENHKHWGLTWRGTV